MRVLVACEESQRVCAAFRKKGHEAYSCDILYPSGGYPEWHIQNNVLPLLNGKCFFDTCDGVSHYIDTKWDMIIAFPPCTYLTNAGNRYFSLNCRTFEEIRERLEKREAAADFFLAFVNADCEKIIIENPVGYMNTIYRKADQIIHPYYFAESQFDEDNYYQKRTCLWIKGVSLLQRKTFLDKPLPKYICQGKKCKGKKIGWCEGMNGIKGGQKERSIARSKTFLGIAEAMAAQWG